MSDPTNKLTARIATMKSLPLLAVEPKNSKPVLEVDFILPPMVQKRSSF